MSEWFVVELWYVAVSFLIVKKCHVGCFGTDVLLKMPHKNSKEAGVWSGSIDLIPIIKRCLDS